MTRYYTLLTVRLKKTKNKNTIKNLVFEEDDCRIMNILFNEKLCNTAGHFYSAVFIFFLAQRLEKIKTDL